jgi:hypothetical protein
MQPNWNHDKRALLISESRSSLGRDGLADCCYVTCVVSVGVRYHPVTLHPHWEFVFQPKCAAYLNLIEPWRKVLRLLALGQHFET